MYKVCDGIAETEDGFFYHFKPRLDDRIIIVGHTDVNADEGCNDTKAFVTESQKELVVKKPGMSMV